MEPTSTQTQTKVTDKAVTAKPEIKTSAVKNWNGKRLYELNFRIGTRKPISKMFELDGDLHDAIQRGRDHCTKMNYLFCGVYPFIVDLDKQEASRKDELINQNFD